MSVSLKTTLSTRKRRYGLLHVPRGIYQFLVRTATKYYTVFLLFSELQSAHFELGKNPNKILGGRSRSSMEPDVELLGEAQFLSPFLRP